PKLSTAFATNCSGKARSVISPGTAIALPPAALIASAVSFAGAGSRSQTTTDAPSDANSFAAAAPIPRPEPVRIATLPSSRIMLYSSFVLQRLTDSIQAGYTSSIPACPFVGKLGSTCFYPGEENVTLVDGIEKRLAQPVNQTPALPCLHTRHNQIGRWGYCTIEAPSTISANHCALMRPEFQVWSFHFRCRTTARKGRLIMVSSGFVPWHNRAPRPFPAK